MKKAESDHSAWIQHWKKLGPMLDEQSRIELQNLSLGQRQMQIKNLLELAWQFRQERTDTGLAELKRKLSRVFGT